VHEHSIADEIFKVLYGAAQNHGASRILSATIHVGEFAGVTQDALQDGIVHCCEHVDMQPFPVHVIVDKPTAVCADCDCEFEIEETTQCPNCGGDSVSVRPATGITVKHVELA